jgi:homospermidine synthase
MNLVTRKELHFTGHLVMVGFGCIGQGVLPLLLRHIDMSPGQITLLSADADGAAIARAFGVNARLQVLTEGNLRSVLQPLLARDDCLLNVSVEVSSVALIELCRECGALYLDTCIEPWSGAYIDALRVPAARTNYALREAALALRGSDDAEAPTAVLTHGANPGLVSHFVKQALLDVAAATGAATTQPRDREGWARLARDLGVAVIHIAERDTQTGTRRKALGEFVNTWSVHGFVSEGRQPAELGWGSHERVLPPQARRHESGCGAAIYLARPGAATQVRTWTPEAGPQLGYLITHGEAISIADWLTLGPPDCPQYRPTVHYAYHPCDDALLSLHELAGRNWRLQERWRVLKDEIVAGGDELGVLLMGHARNAYWYGSNLSIGQARALAPHNSATSLQVTAAVTAGVVWALQNPRRGVVEPEDLPFDQILALCRPYLGRLVGAFSAWTPLQDRGWLFEEDVDRSDPWQFRNFLVS